jgi:sulfoxide reductase catalytic subunit YedY
MMILPSRSDRAQAAASDITPQSLYLNRRTIIQGLAVGTAGLAASCWGVREALAQSPRAGQLTALASVPSKLSGAMSLDKLTTYKDATTYNNFYEFGTDKADPAKRAHALKTDPWSIEIEGLVKKPARVNLEDLMKWGGMEERIYRLRCVEGWSMVIPWIGYSLAELIRRVEPMPGAKFVEFVTQADPKTMPGLRSSVLDWPYVEALRMDEAMHPLTLLAFGMYGEVMPKQNGAPLRLVVPWKYGFKSGKSLVKIRFTDKQPLTSWEKSAPQEYGFYSNVNPNVDHPRWSQATERRIGEDGLLAKRRKTLIFNGYEPQVGQLYAGMDLKKFF